MAITAESGAVRHKRYDPWAVRKDPGTWDTGFLGGLTDRGYTMHSLFRPFGKHLDDFGLINMNGRVYDPLLGRFLSPDNHIQAPGNPQNYNRYSYVLNNPLKYTDPSGYEYQPHQDDKNWNQSALYNTMMGQRINDGFNWMYSMMDIQTQWLHMGAQRFNDLYGMGAFSTMTSLHNFKNALKNSGSYHFTGEGAQNLFGMMQQGSVDGFNLYDVEAFGRHTIVSSQGDIGLIEFGQSGGIGFSNPTASVFMSIADVGFDANTGAESFYTSVPDWVDKTNTGVGAFMVGNNTKEQLISYAARTGNIGKTGAKYLKVIRSTGFAGSVFGMGVSGYNIYNDYSQGGIESVNGWDIADFGAGAAGLGATIFLASNPVGWAISGGVAIYFTVRLTHDVATDD